MAAALRLLARLFALFPLRERVALLSRQSSRLSLDYRLLIEALKRERPDVEVVCCLSDPETKSRWGFVSGTLRQLRFASTSRVCVVDGYVPAVSIPKKRRGVTVVQLWHALGAVKKFGYQSLDTPAGRTTEAARAGRMHANYDAVVAGGPGAVEAFAAAFGYDADVVRPLGLPRQDYLLDPAPDSERRVRARSIVEARPELVHDAPAILYAPTLRRGKDEGWLVRYVQELAAWLPPNVRMIVAGHPLDCCTSGFDADSHPNVSFSSGIPTIDLLELVDCVVTDYSAVAFEAGCLQTGVYFYIPDIEEYRSSPGLNIDPMLEFPGCASSDARELMEEMVLPNLTGANKEKDDFQRFEERYFAGIGFGSCDRLVALIGAAMDADGHGER